MKTYSPFSLSPTQQQWVEQTLKSLSPREKIGQTQMGRFSVVGETITPEAIAKYLEKYPVGSFFSGGEIIKGAGDSADAIRKDLELCQKFSKIPLLVAGDLENGAGCAVGGLTTFPNPMAMGAAHDEKIAYDYGKYTALEGRAAGFNWTFSPVVDLLENWLNPVVGNRAIGSDPDHVAQTALAIIRGMQDHGLAACAKHFPGDGIDFRDQHLITSINSLSREEWLQRHGGVFQKTITAGVATIMIGHIALPWLEPIAKNARRPRPATVSRHIITELLRGEMGFQGVVVSDALEMAGFTGWAPYRQRIVEAFNAGNDVMLWPGDNYFEVMEQALEDGAVTLERLDESVRRILTMKAALGLCDIDKNGHDVNAPELHGKNLGPELNAEVLELSQKVAQKSITLVRNDAQLLPLNPSKTKRILLHKALNPTNGRRTEATKQLAEELKKRNIELTILENGNCLDLWNLEKKGQRWDAYIIAFDLQIHHAKNTFRPIGEMAEVMWTLQNTDTTQPIVVSFGTPFLLHDMPFLDTLVNAYSPSEKTVKAFVAALFGEIPFGTFSPVDVGGEWLPPSR